MVLIVLLGIACAGLVGGMILEDLGVLDRWARRKLDRALRARRASGRF